MKNKPKKQKKEKITYIDDNRTISDMSGVKGGLFSSSRKKKKDSVIPPLNQSPWQTYWGAVRMMLLPMFVVLGLIAVVFLLLYLSMR